MTLTLSDFKIRIWPWSFKHTLVEYECEVTTVQVKYDIFFIWPSPWSNDLDTQTCSRYGQDVSGLSKCGSSLKWIKVKAWRDRSISRLLKYPDGEN